MTLADACANIVRADAKSFTPELLQRRVDAIGALMHRVTTSYFDEVSYLWIVTAAGVDEADRRGMTLGQLEDSGFDAQPLADRALARVHALFPGEQFDFDSFKLEVELLCNADLDGNGKIGR